MVDPPSDPPTQRSSRNLRPAAPIEPTPPAPVEWSRPAAVEVTVRVTVRLRSVE